MRVPWNIDVGGLINAFRVFNLIFFFMEKMRNYFNGIIFIVSANYKSSNAH